MKKIREFFIKEESGDIAIEALFGLIIFILAYTGVLMFGMLMRLEASTQYAVDQVAKEVSQYYYIVERAGLLPDEPAVADTGDTDTLIKDGKTLVSDANTAINNFGAFFGSGEGDLSTIQSNVQTLKNDSNGIYNTIKSGDWGTQVKNILALTIKSGADRIFGQFIAGPICKMLFPKYLPASDADQYLENYGIEGGMDGMNFGCSTFIADGYSINVVLIYKVNLKKLTFGLYDEDVYIRQVGSTQAWIYYANAENKQNVQSVWAIQPDMSRGKAMVEYFEKKNEYGMEIEGSRIGFDLYDSSSKTLTEIHSTNPYNSTVLVNKDENGEYTLDEKKTRTYIKKYCTEALNNIPKTSDGKKITVDGKEIVLEGTEKHQVLIVLPEEAKADFGAKLDAIQKELAEEYSELGLEVKFTYEMKGKPENLKNETQTQSEESSGE